MKNEYINLSGIDYPVITLYNTKNYAVHRTIYDEESYTYTIVYKEYGLRVVTMSNKTQAIKLCCELNSKFKHPLNYKENVKAFIIHFMNMNSITTFHLRTYNY